jgi:hypothetical protein
MAFIDTQELRMVKDEPGSFLTYNDKLDKANMIN